MSFFLHRLSLTNIISACFASLFILSSCKSDETEIVLESLDDAIEKRDEYEKIYLDKQLSFKKKIAEERDNSSKWETYARLFNLQKKVDLESASNSFEHMVSLATSPDEFFVNEINKAFIASSRRNYESAYQILRDAEKMIRNVGNKQAYYSALSSFYGTLLNDTEENIFPKDSVELWQTECLAKLSSLNLPNNTIKDYYKARYLQQTGKYSDAVFILDSIALGNNGSLLGHIRFNAAKCYNSLGNRKMWKIRLAQAAMEDISHNQKSYRALHDLALCLYEDRDYKRAEHYLDVALEDAINSRHETRIVSTNEVRMVITNLREQKERVEHSQFYFIAIFLAITVLFLFIVVLYHKKENTILEHANQKISEAEKKKEQYLFLCIGLLSSCIKEMENFRHSIIKDFKEEDPEDLLKKLRSPDKDYKRYTNFYSIFDQVITAIYPNIAEEVDSALHNKNGHECQSGKLSTSIRIIALIKMGISKSSEIASFLNIPVNTVYTYRTKYHDAIEKICGTNLTDPTLTSTPPPAPASSRNFRHVKTTIL